MYACMYTHTYSYVFMFVCPAQLGVYVESAQLAVYVESAQLAVYVSVLYAHTCVCTHVYWRNNACVTLGVHTHFSESAETTKK